MPDETEEGTPVGVSRRAALTAAAGVAAVILVLVAIRVVSSRGHEPAAAPPRATGPKGAGGARPGLVSSLPEQPVSAIGAGSAHPLTPSRLPPLTRAGKPLVVYSGAEWCPFGAAERGALGAALGRFGQFHGLTLTRSSSSDVYPNTV